MPQVCPLPHLACKIATTGTTPITPVSSGIDHIFRTSSPTNDHASQVLSCSFKNAAPYDQEPETPKTGTPAQET